MIFFSSSTGRCLLLVSSSAAVADDVTSKAPAVNCAADNQSCLLVMELSAGDQLLRCVLQIVKTLLHFALQVLVRTTGSGAVHCLGMLVWKRPILGIAPMRSMSQSRYGLSQS